MTAFGRGEALNGGYRFVVEVRCQNHRFCDIRVKLPRKYNSFEERIRQRLSGYFSRGRIEVSVLADESREKIRHLSVDVELAKTYNRLLLDLREELGLKGGHDLEALLLFRDIFFLQEDEGSFKQAWGVLEKALDEAVTACLDMRAEEGTAIEADFTERLVQMEALRKEIEVRAPTLVQEIRDRLQKRLQELLDQPELDETRLAQEVAFLAEKSDITEELIRFQSHIQQFKDLLGTRGPRGRQLEFLLQEMHREINTIGSKSNDLAISQKVIRLKTELERLREQVQNVE